ncbi:MAG: HicB family protein [Bacteroidetes bacterium 4484_249]|nr:MAG: HicB family protein [Bacteroidetes bacterium 4484_249]
MINLDYSLIIEATEEPDYFGFYSPEIEGFTGIGHSVEDCLYKAKWGMKEHIELLKKQNLKVPARNQYPKIIIQNEQKLQPV